MHPQQAAIINSDTQKQNDQNYQAAWDQYQKRLADYNNTISNKKVLATGAQGTQLLGTLGEPGANYFKDLALKTNVDGATDLVWAGWGDKTQIIGAQGKADFGKQVSYTDPQGNTHTGTFYAGVSDGNPNNFYDITDQVHNNGSIVLTNAGWDGSQFYDLKLNFKNTDNAQQRGQYGDSRVFIGQANDTSIEFDYYGGFMWNPDGSNNGNGGIDISDMQWLYHGTNTPVPKIIIGTLYSDLDFSQSFNTNLGNLLTWTPEDSHVSISGDKAHSDRDTSQQDAWGNTVYYTDWNGFNSAPAGTVMTVGSGNDFYYYFHNSDDPAAQMKDNATHSESGVQFNLFGKAAAVPLPPTAPTPASTTIHYHYDVSAGNCSCRTLLLQSSHSKFAKKEPHKRGLIIVYSAFLSLLKSVSC